MRERRGGCLEVIFVGVVSYGIGEFVLGFWFCVWVGVMTGFGSSRFSSVVLLRCSILCIM